MLLIGLMQQQQQQQQQQLDNKTHFSPLTNFHHPAFELISLKKYNKDTLVDLVSSAWIFQRSLYFCLF